MSHTVKAGPPEGLDADGWLTTESQQISGHQRSGERPWLAIVHGSCQASWLEFALSLTPLGEDSWKLRVWNLLDSAPCSSALGWFQSVPFTCNKIVTVNKAVSYVSPAGALSNSGWSWRPPNLQLFSAVGVVVLAAPPLVLHYPKATPTHLHTHSCMRRTVFSRFVLADRGLLSD